MTINSLKVSREKGQINGIEIINGTHLFGVSASGSLDYIIEFNSNATARKHLKSDQIR